MIKKIILMTVLASSITQSEIDFFEFFRNKKIAEKISDAPILQPGDSDTIWKNLSQIVTNTYGIGRNVARIGVRALVDFSGATVKATGYLAEHPKLSVCAALGCCWGYHKWSEIKDDARRHYHRQDPTLRQIIETIKRHWRE